MDGKMANLRSCDNESNEALAKLAVSADAFGEPHTWQPAHVSTPSCELTSPQYWTDDARRYHFDVGPILDTDIESISVNIGPILRRLQFVSWDLSILKHYLEDGSGTVKFKGL